MHRTNEMIDELARSFGEGSTRRNFVKRMALGTGGGLLTALGLAQAPVQVAARRRRCLRAQQPCLSSRWCCPGKTGRVCLNNGLGSGTVCCSQPGGRCAVHGDCCGQSLCNFTTGICG
jgi:hypothetical protein